MKLKHLVLGIGISTCLSGGLWAQQSLPSLTSATSAVASHYATGHNYIGLTKVLRDLSPSFASDNQAPYLDALSRLLGQAHTDEEVMAQFISGHPYSMSVERARLLLALTYLNKQDQARAIYHLDRVKQQGLNKEELSQYLVVRAFLYLTPESGSADVQRAEALLRQAQEGDSEWASRARLYHIYTLWASGRKTQAKSLLLEPNHLWHAELIPEVAYLDALMKFEDQDPSSAIAQSQELIRRYPSIGNRPRLRGAIGQAYHALGDYAQAIGTLSSPTLGTLTEAEAYALGASLYQRELSKPQSQRSFAEAIPALQRAAGAQGERGALAQMALAGAYQAEGQEGQAMMALSSVLNHSHASAKAREEALYQIVEIGFAKGYDSFGSQMRHTERFLKEYPQSTHKPRVMQLLKSYLSVGKDYHAKLELINKLEQQGERLGEAKQDILVRLASSTPTQSLEYAQYLDRAIRLGNLGEAYAIARVMRADLALRQERYADAESDSQAAMSDKHGSTYEGGIATYLNGYALYNQRKYAQAYQAFDRYSKQSQSPTLRADALLRMGDCSLGVGGKLDEAMTNYREAERLSPERADEALYRIASIYKQRANHDQQIATLDRLLEAHPHSAYTADALYDKGRALLVGRKQTKQADQIFAQLERQFPASPTAPLAALERALIHSNEGNEAQAIEAYKHVIHTYPNSHEAQTALADLKSLYAEANKMDEYAAFASSLGGKLQPKADDAVHLKYLALESRIKRGEPASEAIEAFISEHPKSPDKYKAEWLLVDYYTKQGDEGRAIERLNALSKQNLSPEQKMRVYAQLGTLLHKQQRHQEAVDAYQTAYKLSSGSSEESLTLGKKLLDASLTAKQFASATEVASSLLSRPNLSLEDKRTLILQLGKAQEGNKAVKAAATTYARLADSPDSPQGAEALVRRADILLRLGQTKEAQGILEQFVGTGTPQQYWLARAFVLLADSCERLGDLYLAEQYIQSLRDNYKTPEADIQEMIDQRLTKYSKKK